jgi:hypothetical protein
MVAEGMHPQRPSSFTNITFALSAFSHFPLPPPREDHRRDERLAR